MLVVKEQSSETSEAREFLHKNAALIRLTASSGLTGDLRNPLTPRLYLMSTIFLLDTVLSVIIL